MIMDTKIRKLRDFLIDYQLKISEDLDPDILSGLKKFAEYYSDRGEPTIKYDQKTVDYLDVQWKNLEDFSHLLNSIVQYGWSDSLVLIGELEKDISEQRAHLENYISQMLEKFTYDSEIYLSKNLTSEINIKILTYLFSLKNSVLNKKVRGLLGKIKTDLLSSGQKIVPIKTFNFDTYGLRLVKFSANLSDLFGHKSTINDPEKLAKILKIRLILTEQDDLIIYNDQTLLNSVSFPEFQGLNKHILSTNQTTIRLDHSSGKKAKLYRKIVGNVGNYYYLIKYGDLWVLMGKYSDDVPENVTDTLDTVNQKIKGYNSIFNSEFGSLNQIKEEDESTNPAEKDYRHMSKIIKIFDDIIAAEKSKITFDRFKKIIEKNLIEAVKSSIDSELSPTEISITLKYTFGNLINDIISYLNDFWPDTTKIEQSGQYNEKEYARYLLPKISEAFRKSLEKIFNKSNNYSEILAIKEKIYVKDLSK